MARGGLKRPIELECPHSIKGMVQAARRSATLMNAERQAKLASIAKADECSGAAEKRGVMSKRLCGRQEMGLRPRTRADGVRCCRTIQA